MGAGAHGVTFEYMVLVRDLQDRYNDGMPLMECSLCAALVTPSGRERHAATHGHTGWTPE